MKRADVQMVVVFCKNDDVHKNDPHYTIRTKKEKIITGYVAYFNYVVLGGEEEVFRHGTPSPDWCEMTLNQWGFNNPKAPPVFTRGLCEECQKTKADADALVGKKTAPDPLDYTI